MIWALGLAMVGVWCGGLVVGLSVGVRLKRRKPLPEIKAVCEGCGHHESFHEKDSGPCRHHFFDYYGMDKGECQCLRYTGPTPLPTYLPERSIE